MREPLTKADLLGIQERCRDSADARALLWEVFRLRALVLRTQDYFRQTPTSSVAVMMADRLRVELEAEPVVQEQPKFD